MWNQLLSLKAPRGDCSVLIRLIGRNPQRVVWRRPRLKSGVTSKVPLSLPPHPPAHSPTTTHLLPLPSVDRRGVCLVAW